MAPPTASGDVIRVAARHKWNGIDDIVNVFHFTVEDTPVVLDDTLLMIDVGTHLAAAYGNVTVDIVNNALVEDITVYNVSDDYPLGVIPWAGSYVGGTGSGEGLPPGTSGLVRWNTNTKRVRGRTFLPPFVEGSQIDGVLVGGTQGNMSDFADSLRTVTVQANDYSFLLGVWSRSAGQMRVITSFTVQSIMAYQRRRRPGSGS